MGTPTQYTREDMIKFVEMSEEGSVISWQLKDMDYDPVRFKDFLVRHKQAKAIQYLYDIPLEELPLRIEDKHVSGYISFRFSVGK